MVVTQHLFPGWPDVRGRAGVTRTDAETNTSCCGMDLSDSGFVSFPQTSEDQRTVIPQKTPQTDYEPLLRFHTRHPLVAVQIKIRLLEHWIPRTCTYLSICIYFSIISLFVCLILLFVFSLYLIVCIEKKNVFTTGRRTTTINLWLLEMRSFEHWYDAHIKY